LQTEALQQRSGLSEAEGSNFSRRFLGALAFRGGSIFFTTRSERYMFTLKRICLVAADCSSLVSLA
jgi:hypothetical protein